LKQNSRFTAQLRQADGKFGTKLDIKKEVFRNGINQTEMCNAMQMMALQEQLEEIENQTLSIDHSVKDV